MGFAVRLQRDVNGRSVPYDCLGFRRTGSSIPGAEAGRVSRNSLAKAVVFAAGLDRLIRPRFQGLLAKYEAD
jgi:hypothetical protein